MDCISLKSDMFIKPECEVHKVEINTKEVKVSYCSTPVQGKKTLLIIGPITYEISP